MTSDLMMGLSSTGGLSPSLERREAMGDVGLSIAGEGGGLGSVMAEDRRMLVRMGSGKRLDKEANKRLYRTRYSGSWVGWMGRVGGGVNGISINGPLQPALVWMHR